MAIWKIGKKKGIYGNGVANWIMELFDKATSQIPLNPPLLKGESLKDLLELT